MNSKKAKGWGIPEHVELDVDNINVRLGSICTCTWRRTNCFGIRKCSELFEIGGQAGLIRKLKSLMGKDFPKSWDDPKLWVVNYEEAERRSETVESFKREFFKKCRPIEIEVRVKKST